MSGYGELVNGGLETSASLNLTVVFGLEGAGKHGKVQMNCCRESLLAKLAISTTFTYSPVFSILPAPNRHFFPFEHFERPCSFAPPALHLCVC